MDVKETLEKINNGRYKTEAAFVFCVWEDPERFDDYQYINEGKDKTLQDEDAIFYWNLGKQMYHQGIKHFDPISIDSFLTNKKAAKKRYDEYGGYQSVSELRSLINPENTEGYFDKILRMNSLSTICTAVDKMFSNVERFDSATSEDVYNAMELLNNSISLSVQHNADIEDLVVTKKYIEDCESGINTGLNYSKNCPLLNYTTLGLPIGDVYLLAGHSGIGKSSFAFENMAIPISESGIPVCVLSNEMNIQAYQNMLVAHILTKDLNYWELTRKKIKVGKYTDKDKEMLDKAIQISEQKYKGIKFVKLFDNNTTILMKYIKKLANQGVKCFIWDTFKNDDVSDGSDEWLQLLKNSRKVFNLVSKLNISMVMTFQLALYTTNQRYLDASCLSASKQIKEVVSELIMMRKLWQDEYTGEKYDCKPFKYNKDNKKIKEEITLDPNKTYVVVFINKTRNDEGSKEILYQWQGHYNRWIEIGYCTIRNDHRGVG